MTPSSLLSTRGACHSSLAGSSGVGARCPRCDSYAQARAPVDSVARGERAGCSGPLSLITALSARAQAGASLIGAALIVNDSLLVCTESGDALLFSVVRERNVAGVAAEPSSGTAVKRARTEAGQYDSSQPLPVSLTVTKLGVVRPALCAAVLRAGGPRTVAVFVGDMAASFVARVSMQSQCERAAQLRNAL
jgi:hypothetical protein